MKGVAHVGVLQALTERGLVPSQIVGSSVGALVGAAWSAGKSIAELREIALGLVRKDIFAVAHADMAFKRMRSPALFRREPLDHLLHRLVGDITFQDLDNPLIVNTVDLNSGMQVFWGLDGLDEVPVRDAVFASCALPGYLPPREIRGRFYMDGATVDNLPVGTARILGADVIIAVDVSASNALRADTQDEGFASVFARAAEIAMQTILELRLREWTTPPIYYIHPRVEHISAFDFDHLREVVEEGYRATVAALDRPEEWPAPGDSGVHPRRPDSRHQAVVVAQREIAGRRAEELTVRRDVRRHHRRGGRNRFHWGESEAFEGAGADHHLRRPVRGHHVRVRKVGLNAAGYAQGGRESFQGRSLRTLPDDAHGGLRLDASSRSNDRRMVLVRGETRHAQQSGAPHARRGCESVGIVAERHLATVHTEPVPHACRRRRARGPDRRGMRRDVAQPAVKAAPRRITPAQAGEPHVAPRHEPHPAMTAAPEPPRRQVPHVVDEGTAVPSGVTASLGRNLGVHRDREARGPVTIQGDHEATVA